MNDRYGSENAGKVKKIQEKTKQTILERYGVEHISQINVNKRIIKGNQTLYERGNGSCSKEQQYICNLYKIKPNYPVDKLKLDIAFPNEMRMENRTRI